MNNESNVGQPPTIPLAISPPRRRQTAQSEVSNTNVHKRFQDARSVAITILEAIESSPNTQDFSGDANNLPEDLREAVDKFVSVLSEVNSKLKKISSKYGARKRGIRERIKYFLAMLREDRCSRILFICKDDIALASKVIHENLGDGANEALGSSVVAHLARQTELPVEGSIAGEHSKSGKELSELPVLSSGQELILSSDEVHPTEGLGVPQNEQVRSTAALSLSGGTSDDPGNHREDPKEAIEPTRPLQSSTPIGSQSSNPKTIPDRHQAEAAKQAHSPNVPETQSKSEGLGVPQSEQVHSTAALALSGGTPNDPGNHREDPKEAIKPNTETIPDRHQAVAAKQAQSSNVPETQSKSSRRQAGLNIASKPPKSD
ncbi:hypothetical protein FRC04_001651 [Tulasnella sp. 424]|nr:hypothetical protein FRC04_001651 [Tulasnella sp. 424]